MILTFSVLNLPVSMLDKPSADTEIFSLYFQKIGRNFMQIR